MTVGRPPGLLFGLSSCGVLGGYIQIYNNAYGVKGDQGTGEGRTTG